jgi:ADP-ribose pyrophosphatase YjhB (NUDIX family)
VKAGDPLSQPDRPSGAGLLAQLQFRAGRMAVRAVNLTRPRLSLGVRLFALDSDGRVFLVRHSYLPGLHLPGGGVDAGESCRAAAEREAREEGGLELARTPELFHVYWNRSLDGRDHVVMYVARAVRRAAGAYPEFPEIVATGFYPPDDLPGDVTPATRRRVAEVLHGAAPTETW